MLRKLFARGQGRLWSGPWQPALPGSPRPTDDELSDPADTTYLLATLARIPRAELPDGPARQALAEAIRAGRVDNLYAPIGADYHNIAWRDRPARVDPRQRLSAYVAEMSEQGGDADA